jgi:4-amino-4-deoxy-L-arabinose transferase-like glycosyltransferase
MTQDTSWTTTKKMGLWVVVIAYVLTGFYYTLNLPLYEASDELWHYPTVQYLANNGLALPPQDPDNPGPWRQQGSQPPLYYMVGAVLTAGIDTNDMDEVRRLNPHSDIGVVRPDGNANMMVHNWEREQFPWSGAVLATYVVRIFSILLGAGTVVVTFFTARRIFPESWTLAYVAAIVNAFLPMFVFIASSVNNDNLSNLLGNLLVLVLLWVLGQERINWRHYALIGIITGAGILSKLNIGFLIPIVALVLLLASWREKRWQPLIVGGFISGGLTIAIAGWWYLRNFQLYGDPTGLDRFLDMVGRRPVAADWAQLWAERDSFTKAFWGFFGGVNVVMPEWIYTMLNVLGGLGLASAIVFLIFRMIRRDWTRQRWLLASITILWATLTFLSYTQWTALTIASQGRLVFGALSAILLWMVWGWLWWLPLRLRPVMGVVLSAIFIGIALYVPQGIIAPAYALPDNITIDAVRTDAEFGYADDTRTQLSMFEAEVRESSVQRGEYVNLDVAIRLDDAVDANWSLFVHLVSPDGVIIGQRDVLPGQGSIATSEIKTGRAWNNHIAALVPPNAYVPMTVDVVIGWYNHETGKRLTRLDADEDTLLVGQVKIEAPPEDDIPNSINVHFEDVVRLVGYSLTDLSPEQGQEVTLTLYWERQRTIEDDWVVFANVIDPVSLTKYAESNAMPANWTRPTSTWQDGEIIEDTHTLVVAGDAQPGIYEIEVGLYQQQEDGSFQRLKVLENSNNFVHLTRVRILPDEE